MAAAGHIRLGTASPSPPSSTSATIALIDTLAQRAASSKIDILLLPEAFIGGYPRGSSFGCAIGDRSAAGREEFARYFDNAIDLGDTVGPAGGGAGVKWVKRQLGEEDEVRGDGSREELERIARDTGVFVVVGCIEKAGGSLYCSVVYVCPKEGTLGKRRKVLPTGTERLIWSQGSPSTLRAVTTTIRGIRINLAAAICWESYMPLLRQSLYSQNINLYLAPTADFRDAWLSVMRTVGVEGRCFVVSSNMCIPKGSPAETTETNGTGNGNVPAAREPRERRGSCFTEEGFEIALPKSPSQSRRRRKSVFDEDGNEIVLGCEDDGEAPAPAKRPQLASLKESNKTEFNRADYVSAGGSSIVSPFGDVIAGPQWGDPDGLIYADVDFRDCIRGRLDLDTAGSYSRNDSFKFSVEGLNLDPLPY